MSDRDSYPFGRPQQFSSIPPMDGNQYHPGNPRYQHPGNNHDSHLNQNPNLNPAAGHFHPSPSFSHRGQHSGFAHQDQHRNGTVSHSGGSQVSYSSHMYMDKIRRLEQEHLILRTDVQDLKSMYNGLYSTVETMKKGGWSVNVGPFQDQKAEDFRQKLDGLKLDTLRATGGADVTKEHVSDGVMALDQASTITQSNKSLPPHLRNGSGSLPPHLRATGQVGQSNTSEPPQHPFGVAEGSLIQRAANETSGTKDANNPLVTDGNIDTSTFRTPSPTVELTPPIYSSTTTIATAVELTPPQSSPTTTIQPDVPIQSIEDPYIIQSGKGWMPHYIQSLPPLCPKILSAIPAPTEMVSFSADFLRNIFGGLTWSPGLNYILPSPGPCILANRTYYTLDAEYEPYLPKQPGSHGAKLTAFFNANPEDEFGQDEGTSFTNVPMFVMTSNTKNRARYIYFGNYSQTRWSDKLDYERMVEHVPHSVKQYWAEDLSAVGRPQWVTDALMKHFFPKPEYEGRLFGDSAEDSVTPEEEAKIEQKVLRDVQSYVKELKEWEKDAKLKTAMIKKEFILQAFDRADADDPPALRLWWEYLECVDWRLDFYDMLVKLQSRSKNYL